MVNKIWGITIVTLLLCSCSDLVDSNSDDTEANTTGTVVLESDKNDSISTATNVDLGDSQNIKNEQSGDIDFYKIT